MLMKPFFVPIHNMHVYVACSPVRQCDLNITVKWLAIANEATRTEGPNMKTLNRSWIEQEI
jgi:hypothetical protein